MTAQERNQFAYCRVITYHLRHSEQRCFKSSRSRSHQSRLRMTQQTVSLAKHNLGTIRKIMVIEFQINARSSGYHKLILRKRTRSFHHTQEIVLDFLLTASRQKCDNWARRFQIQALAKLLFRFSIRTQETVYSIHTRVAYIIYRIMVTIEKINLERKYGKQLIHITTYILDSILLPSPYLRRYIIIYRYLSMLFDVSGYLKIESRIIHQYQHIRLPRFDVVLASVHIAEYSTQMQQHGDEAHVSQFAIMLYARSAYGSHQITTEETEFSFRIFRHQRLHQVRCVKVARCLAYYQIILHTSRFHCSSCSIKL